MHIVNDVKSLILNCVDCFYFEEIKHFESMRIM